MLEFMFHPSVTQVTGLRDKVTSSKGTGDERQDKTVGRVELKISNL